MSAIWGIWRRDGNPAAADDLARMAGRLERFGPDGRDQWHSGGIGLGRMLAMTVPEDSFDSQPVRLAGGGLLVADLRLDNRAELAADLGIQPARERAMADSTLLAAAWERWQEGCLNRLAGAFAFALWDAGAQRLFCARDQLGRRPLVYFARGPLFAFASVPRGLRGVPEIPWEVDDSMIAIRLACLPENGERTPFRQIRKLPPGHCMRIGPAGEAVWQYWEPELERRLELPDDAAYREAFRAVFDEAVRCRLRARAPVGSMLSGGFDSGSVSATAATLLAGEGRSLTAFTAVPAPEFTGMAPPGRFANEAGHAAAVAALHPNITHVLVPPLPVCPLDLVARQWIAGDSPGGHFSMLPHARAMGEAHRRAGVGVVLTGVQGNMTISYRAWPLLPQLLRRGRWRQWYSEARALHTGGNHGWPGLLALTCGPWMPAWLWRAIQSPHGTHFCRVRRYVLLHPEYFRSGELRRLADETGWDLSYRPPADGVRNRLAGLLRFDYGASAATAMAQVGVDFRDPTGDRRLVEFCLAVPEEQYLRNGRARYLLRGAMAGRLPAKVLDESRRGLCGADWYLRVAPFQSRFVEAVEQIAESPAARRCLDLPRMRQLAAHWPSDWSTAAAFMEHGMGLCRAVYVGTFMRWVEGGA